MEKLDNIFRTIPMNEQLPVIKSAIDEAINTKNTQSLNYIVTRLLKDDAPPQVLIYVSSFVFVSFLHSSPSSWICCASFVPIIIHLSRMLKLVLPILQMQLNHCLKTNLKKFV
jgi:hypothetical protein